MEQPLALLKRKIFQFIEDSENDLSMGELLRVPSDFAKSCAADFSK